MNKQRIVKTIWSYNVEVWDGSRWRHLVACETYWGARLAAWLRKDLPHDYQGCNVVWETKDQFKGGNDGKMECKGEDGAEGNRAYSG